MTAQRVFTAAVLLPLLLGALFFLPNAGWAAVLLAALLAGAWEWGTLAGYSRRGKLLFSCLMLVSCALIWRFSPGPALYLAAVPFWGLLVPLWLKFKWRVANVWLLGVAGGLVLLPTWHALVRLQSSAPLLLAALGVVWVADSAAYFAGRKFGRRRLAPRISPGKSWEGVAGAYGAITLYCVLVWLALPEARAAFGAATGWLTACLITALSIEGDLFESWLKRVAGVKDSGRILPGHGGILDRIDGLTASMPIAALVLSWRSFA